MAQGDDAGLKACDEAVQFAVTATKTSTNSTTH